MELVSIILLFLKTWWWLILSIILYFPTKFLYLWWIRWEIWYKELDWIVLEIVPPGEIEKPFRAMEDIYASFWPIYDSPNWRERWCEGELNLAPFWFSFEVASFEGEIHFYVRTERGRRKLFESVIHAHYPEAEIFEVEDYTKNVPQDIPNQKFSLYGEDFVFMKEDYYPIKTFKFFEPTRPEAVVGEKKIDPFYSLLEELTKLRKGEQGWFQIVAAPIADKDIPWITKGREAANKIARRPSKAKQKSIVQEAIDVILGKTSSETAREKGLPPGVSPEIEKEMLITPGERAILTAIEEKISKYGFKTWMRYIYIYPNEAYFSPKGKIARSYFAHFSTQDMNTIIFSGKTRTKIHYLFKRRRLYSRRRNIFEKYIRRFPPSYPSLTGHGNIILNTEELATIFHFPTKASILPPGVPRVFAKKGEPPPGIPLE